MNKLHKTTITMCLVLTGVFTFSGVLLSDDLPTRTKIERSEIKSVGTPKLEIHTITNETGRYLIEGEYIVDTKTGIVKNFKSQLGVTFDKMGKK